MRLDHTAPKYLEKLKASKYVHVVLGGIPTSCAMLREESIFDVYFCFADQRRFERVEIVDADSQHVVMGESDFQVVMSRSERRSHCYLYCLIRCPITCPTFIGQVNNPL